MKTSKAGWYEMVGSNSPRLYDANGQPVEYSTSDSIFWWYNQGGDTFDRIRIYGADWWVKKSDDIMSMVLPFSMPLPDWYSIKGSFDVYDVATGKGQLINNQPFYYYGITEHGSKTDANQKVQFNGKDYLARLGTIKGATPTGSGWYKWIDKNNGQGLIDQHGNHAGQLNNGDIFYSYNSRTYAPINGKNVQCDFLKVKGKNVFAPTTAHVLLYCQPSPAPASNLADEMAAVRQAQQEDMFAEGNRMHYDTNPTKTPDFRIHF